MSDIQLNTPLADNDPRPVALVTGAGKRVGAAIARKLQRENYRVVIHFNHSRTHAEALASELNALKVNSAALVQADLGDVNSLPDVAKKTLQVFGRCDLLVNNASSFYPTPVGKATVQQWQDLFASNAQAPFFLAQALIPELQKNNGSIINICDVHAHRPLREHTLYCMAKAANKMLTQSLALELAPTVRVNGVAPGAVLWPEGSPPSADRLEEKLQAIPLQQLGGAEAIADAVAFLAQPQNYITGQILNVDGGKSLLQ
ncbi:pteridine reductase [Teredinibacter waterburyi]|jgi:Dehydrogenases with different specificities (related to short-chain alcohol dehydrogenases)|uniref:pteridine reductase n=1 Tax=Teredinibacter waterburyi TaxID=1500538 RepID=UPI00166000DE|nr:pteridine reductase [Teredinibacter waterburyi]